MTEIDTDKLAERLRRNAAESVIAEICPVLVDEAADAILSMAEENKRLREALGPFARHVGKDGEIIRLEWGKDHWTGTLSPEDFTRARRALGKDKA